MHTTIIRDNIEGKGKANNRKSLIYIMHNPGRNDLNTYDQERPKSLNLIDVMKEG